MSIERQSNPASFVQPSLEGLEVAQPPETLLENCVVTKPPTYYKVGQGYTWDSEVYAQPDLLHQDRDTTYFIHAHHAARLARSKSVKPGDVVSMKGVEWTQEIELAGGEKKVVYHFTFSDISVHARSPRKSVTAYEIQHGK